MNEQTENYIILKPIAERFNRVAEEIMDNDIKYIIKETMREQVKKVIDFGRLEDMINEVIEDNEESIKEMIVESISNRIKFK